MLFLKHSYLCKSTIEFDLRRQIYELHSTKLEQMLDRCKNQESSYFEPLTQKLEVCRREHQALVDQIGACQEKVDTLKQESDQIYSECERVQSALKAAPEEDLDCVIELEIKARDVDLHFVQSALPIFHTENELAELQFRERCLQSKITKLENKLSDANKRDELKKMTHFYEQLLIRPFDFGNPSLRREYRSALRENLTPSLSRQF